MSDTVIPAAVSTAPYPDRPNSLQVTKTSFWMWLSLLGGFFLMLWLTMLAITHNPLYSNPANGISKYKFIEGCRDAIEAEVAQAARIQPGLSVSLNARDLVENTTAGFQNVPGSRMRPVRGWTMLTPMQVHRPNYPTQTTTLGCHYRRGGKINLIR